MGFQTIRGVGVSYDHHIKNSMIPLPPPPRRRLNAQKKSWLQAGFLTVGSVITCPAFWLSVMPAASSGSTPITCGTHQTNKSARGKEGREKSVRLTWVFSHELKRCVCA